MQKTKLIIAELNTWVWLHELENKYEKKMTLENIH